MREGQRGSLLYYVLVRCPKAVLHRLKVGIATLYHWLILKSVGRGTRIMWGAKFVNPNNVVLGRDCLVWYGVAGSSENRQSPLQIGDRVHLNHGVFLDYTGGLTIADDVLVSEDAVIYTHDHGFDPHSLPVHKPKVIEQGAWVGMRAIVLPNCRIIGKGSVIGAGAVVSKDVPEFAVVSGNPAKIIRNLAKD